jgi:hypothetical protein
MSSEGRNREFQKPIVKDTPKWHTGDEIGACASNDLRKGSFQI